MYVKFYLKASLEDLSRLASAVAALQPELECSDRKMLEIGLVIEELCANIISHGARRGASQMAVELETESNVLTMTVTDDGPPFDPTTSPQADICKPLNERCPGGLGIHLVRHYTESIDYRREDGNNVVRMTKNIKGSS